MYLTLLIVSLGALLILNYNLFNKEPAVLVLLFIDMINLNFFIEHIVILYGKLSWKL